MRLIDADVLLEKVREIRKLALDRAVETPANMPFPIYQNPAYTRYSTQADEREKFKVMIEEAPSAQPDIIRCKDCKHWNPQLKTANGNGLGSCDFHNVALVTSEGFCYWAEKRGEQDG